MADFDFSTLITDRSQADLEALRDLLATPMADWTAEQLAEFNRAASKGAYNYTDLNRVIAAMDDINERLTAAGYETGYRRIVVHEQVPDPAPYRYLRMQINAVRSGSQVQLSEIRLVDKDGNSYQWPSGTQVTTSLNYRTGEGPDNLIDGNPATKLYSGSFTPGSTITIDLGAGNTVDVAQYSRWQWYTANDRPNRDPVSFDLQISNDGNVWETADSVTGADITEMRETLAYTGQIETSQKAGYTQVEYLVFSGTQYIDTGLRLTQNTRFITRFRNDQTPNSAIFGADGGWQINGFGVWVNPTIIAPVFGSQTGSIGLTFGSELDEIQLDSTGVRFNGSQVWSVSGATPFTTPTNLAIGAVNRAGTIYEQFVGRIGKTSIEESGITVREYIPVRDPDGALGMYDTINNVFVPNSGSGVFSSGPVVPGSPDLPEPEPGPDPYTWYESDTPTASLMAEYLSNVSALRAVLDLPETTPEVPADMDRLTQAEANAIEAVLDIINTYLVALQSIFRRCGARICGGPELYFVN